MNLLCKKVPIHVRKSCHPGITGWQLYIFEGALQGALLVCSFMRMCGKEGESASDNKQSGTN